jgi:hypothetical protein
MIEQGKEYNPETAQNLRPRRFSFEGASVGFSYELQIPEYILARLNSVELDKLQDHMNKYALEVVTKAIQGGYLFTDSGRAQMRKDVALQLKMYIYERFSVSQEQAGNASWQVPESLQEVIH